VKFWISDDYPHHPIENYRQREKSVLVYPVYSRRSERKIPLQKVPNNKILIEKENSLTGLIVYNIMIMGSLRRREMKEQLNL